MKDKITVFKRWLAFYRDESGAVAILVGLLLAILLFFGALAIDVGYMMVAKNELQNAADATALAGARTLGRLYECNGDIVTCPGPMSYEDQLTYLADPVPIVASIDEVAAKNEAGSKAGITIRTEDDCIFNWDPDNPLPKDNVCVSALTRPTAVRVVARRDSLSNGPISTFLAKLMGINTVNVSAIATAALTGQTTISAGGLSIPIGISSLRASSANCEGRIDMSPTKDSCAGWHTFTSKTHSAEQLREILQRLLPSGLRDKQYANKPTYVSPAVTSDPPTKFNFSGGDVATDFADLEALFLYMKDKDGDGKDDVWTTSVVIYEETGTVCGNPQNDILILGVTTLEIHEVVGPSGKYIYGILKCGFVKPGKGGGGPGGANLGSIPSLVQ